MKHLSKITVTGALLFTLGSTAFAETGMTNGIQDTTPMPTDTTSPQDTTTTQTPAPVIQQTTTDQSKIQQPMQNGQRNMPVTFTSDNIPWKDAPKMYPAGAQFAILEGNPKARGGGSVTVRLKMPANYQIPPVYVTNAERITVLSGTLNIGMGDKLDTNAGTALPAGSFMLMPARKHHYAWTSEETVLQISGNSPMNLKYINAKDDPRLNKATPAVSQPDQTQPTTTNGTMNPTPATPSQPPSSSY